MSPDYTDPMALERARWKLVLGTIGIGVGLMVVFWATNFGLWGGWILAIGLNALILRHCIRQKDGFMTRLWLFGVVAGFAELPSDAFSVGEGVLLYPDVGPFLWTSPAYMPFGYSVLLVQFGFIARYFLKRFGMTKAIVLTGLVGGLNVPIYEYLADGAGFWFYQDTWMLFGTVPPFIIVGEIALAAVLPPMVRHMERSGWIAPIGWGLVEGAVMYVGWSWAFALLQ